MQSDKPRSPIALIGGNVHDADDFRNVRFPPIADVKFLRHPSTMKSILVPLTALLTVACSHEQPIGSCGSGFCLPGDAKILNKQTPAEDFNLYQVAWRGDRFVIYEGNHPKGLNDTGGSVFELPLRRAGTLRVSGGQGSVIFDTQNKWPAYVDIMGPCPSPEDCRVKSLARAITFRT